MALVVPIEGEASILENLVNKTAPQNLVLKLFTNNYTPVKSSVAANFTEAAGFGYASINLTPASFSVSGGNPSTITYPQQTFTFSGALGAVYGYYVVESSSGKVKWAERFTDGPYIITNPGDQIKITLNLNDV